MTDRANQTGSPPEGGRQAADGARGPADPLQYAREALRLNGIAASEADVALTAAELERALEIATPMLDFELPDGLDQAGVFRP